MAHAYAQRSIKRVIERSFIEPARRGLFLLEAGRVEPSSNFGLNRRICRPAVGAAAPVGANEDIGGRGRGVPDQKKTPCPPLQGGLPLARSPSRRRRYQTPWGRAPPG